MKFKAMTFSEDIKAIDSCRVCHSGPEYHVEIDVVIDGETPLWRAHDIAQDLQDQLEALPNINRCFVHIDHETEHKPVSTSITGSLGMEPPSRLIGRAYHRGLPLCRNIESTFKFQSMYLHMRRLHISIRIIGVLFNEG